QRKAAHRKDQCRSRGHVGVTQPRTNPIPLHNLHSHRSFARTVLVLSNSTLALITVPFFTGVIGYVTNWTGVLMLFYPVHFRGFRSRALRSLARVLPRRVQQIPGVMLGGIGWQGIVPSRAAKMGSLAVDAGIAKLGTPSEFFRQLDPEKIAEQIVVSTRGEIPQMVSRIMEREHPQLWRNLPPPLRGLLI